METGNYDHDFIKDTKSDFYLIIFVLLETNGSQPINSLFE